MCEKCKTKGRWTMKLSVAYNSKLSWHFFLCCALHCSKTFIPLSLALWIVKLQYVRLWWSWNEHSFCNFKILSNCRMPFIHTWWCNRIIYRNHSPFNKKLLNIIHDRNRLAKLACQVKLAASHFNEESHFLKNPSFLINKNWS